MSKAKHKEISYTGHALKRWTDRVGATEDELVSQLKALIQLRPSKTSPLRKCNKGQYAAAKFYNFQYNGKFVTIPIETKNNKLVATTVLT